MHSSRMRTARLLLICPSMHCSGGVPTGGYLILGVYLPEGVYLPGGYLVPGGTLPPVNRMTDRYKNITLPQTSFAGGNKYQKHSF